MDAGTALEAGRGSPPTTKGGRGGVSKFRAVAEYGFAFDRAVEDADDFTRELTGRSAELTERLGVSTASLAGEENRVKEEEEAKQSSLGDTGEISETDGRKDEEEK